MSVRINAGPLLCMVLLGCTAEAVPTAEPGSHWPGLSAEDVAAFQAGQALFQRAFTVAEGLGPTFNQARCSSCHDVPTPGGAGVERVLKGTRYENGRCDLLSADGGDVFQIQTTPALHALGFPTEPISRRANAIIEMAAPALYGLSALEAVPDEAILAGADPDDRDGDGISGRVGRTADGRVARFGRMARFATLREFAADAFLREMGLTSTLFPEEESLAGRPLPAGSDPATDPEIDDTVLGQITRYLELLAFPGTDTPAEAAARDTIAAGRRLFQGLGCAACHTPTMRAGPSRIQAVSGRVVPLYSDLLLHDMGPELASICAPGVEPAEWRTAPLYGLRFRMQFLNDGRVQVVESAIRLHGGEATSSRARFEGLSPTERSQLLRFLMSL